MRIANLNDPIDKVRYEKMIFLVHRMLWWEELLAKARADDEKASLERKIDSAENQIHELMYDLYHLSPEVLANVEGRM